MSYPLLSMTLKTFKTTEKKKVKMIIEKIKNTYVLETC